MSYDSQQSRRGAALVAHSNFGREGAGKSVGDKRFTRSSPNSVVSMSGSKQLDAKPACPTYIVACDQLAGRYIENILATDLRLQPIQCDVLPQADKKSRTVVFVFVLDNSSVPRAAGLCLRRILLQFPKAKFVAIGVARSNEEIAYILKSGFHGFVDHSTVAERLLDAVHSVTHDTFWVSTEAMQTYMRIIAQPVLGSYGNINRMTDRESEVYDLVKRRLTNKEIGDLLGIRESTVKYHVTHILEKLQVATRHEIEQDNVPTRIWDRLFQSSAKTISECK